MPSLSPQLGMTLTPCSPKSVTVPAALPASAAGANCAEPDDDSLITLLRLLLLLITPLVMLLLTKLLLVSAVAVVEVDGLPLVLARTEVVDSVFDVNFGKCCCGDLRCVSPFEEKLSIYTVNRLVTTTALKVMMSNTGCRMMTAQLS